MSKMTKKEFKEKIHESQYGKRSLRLHGVFFDWKITDEGCGFRCGMIAHEVTKKEAFDIAYDWFVNGNEPDEHFFSFIEYFIAETDAERRKVPLHAKLDRSHYLVGHRLRINC